MSRHNNRPGWLSCERGRYFEKCFPQFRKPVEIGCFSQDSTGEFHNDKRQLRYYVHPSDPERLDFDLRQGYDQLIRKDESQKCYINDMLQWIMTNHDRFSLPDTNTELDNINSLNTDFVCWRGLLSKLLCTPYEDREGWLIAVCLFNGTYYLCEFETDEKKKDTLSRSRRQDEMCYWGWKFEQYVATDVENGEPNTHRPVNNNEGFCSVVRTRLNSHSLVFGGEVDAVDTRNPQRRYVEMKTTRNIETKRQNDNFLRFKSIKWWAQSFLIGILTIICGYRDDSGSVQSVREMDVQQLPKMAESLHGAWKPAVCFNFLDSFLKFVKEHVTRDDSRTVYLCEWWPGNDINCSQMPSGSEFDFLPKWFTSWNKWKSNASSTKR